MAFCLLTLFCLPPARAQLPMYGSFYLHDPGTMIKDGTNYYIYGDGQGILGIKSADLRNWTAAATVFPSGPPPWTSNDLPAFTNVVSGTTNITAAFSGYFWAPDIAYFNGSYHLYYACSQWATRNSAIGVATSPSLNSPSWTDQGKVVESYYPAKANTDTIAFNCIDPSILVDANGTVWMSYGSYSDGIVVTQIDPTTGLRLNSTSIGTKVASSTTTYDQNSTEASCLYQRGGYYYLFLNYGGCCSGVNSTYNIRVGRSSTVTGPYFDKNGTNMLRGGGKLVLESVGRFIGPGHAAIMNDNGTNWFTYHYYDGKNNGAATVGLNRIYWTADAWPALTNDWSAFYTFNTDAREHLGLYDGSLKNKPTITNDSPRGSVLNLDGVTNFVSFPLSTANASTFAAWVKWRGGADWQRIFDFGSSTTNYFFLTARAPGAGMRFGITTNGNTAEQQINAASALSTNSWVHVAVTLDGAKGLLYLDGAPVATNNALTIRPWQVLAKNNYLGKSQWPDPLFSGEISSLRIFGRALSAAEIRGLAYAHPALAHRYSFNLDAPTAAWDSIGMAHGTLMGNAVITNGALRLAGDTGGYVNLPGGLVSGSSALTVEFWATFGVNASWARVFDFGNISGSSGQNFTFYSPHTAASGQRFGISTAAATVNFDPAGTLDNRTLQVVCILDPTNSYCAIYTNAVLQSAVTNALPVLTGVSSAWSFIGRSLFSADGWLNATIDELRIYDGRLTPQEIFADYKSGPDVLALPVALTPSNSVSGLTLSWPSWAVGFVPETASALDTAWSLAAQSPTLLNDRWWLALSRTNSQTFYRLRR